MVEEDESFNDTDLNGEVGVWESLSVLKSRNEAKVGGIGSIGEGHRHWT